MSKITPQTARKIFMKEFNESPIEIQAGTIEALTVLHEAKLAGAKDQGKVDPASGDEA